MKMCYRGIHYDYDPIFINSNSNPKYFVNHNVTNTETRQIKFLGKICVKTLTSLPVKKKNIRFLGQQSDRTMINQTKVN